MPISNVWVFIEAAEGNVASASLELLSKAAEVGGEVTGVYPGDGAEVAGVVGSHGGARVLATGDLSGKLLGAHLAAAMAARIEGGDRPDLILLPQSYDGRDVAARLSVAIDRTVLTNNVDLQVDGDTVQVVEPVFGGTVNVTTRFAGEPPYLALCRPKSFEPTETGGGPAEVVALEVPDVGAVGKASVVDRHIEEHEGPTLDDAEIVVSGGRGLGAAEKYELIENLAKALKAAPGASRAIVDAGWVPYSYQVGQTGKVVKPLVYIAAGISGATQHLVGMKGSKNIIAINKDPEAPIFGVADLGIVGDVHNVIPKLIEELQGKL